jgi:hypothetical protein
VKRLTGGVQQPWVSSSPVDGEFYFAGLPPAPATAVPPPAVAVQPDAETLFWQSISASSNPELYQAYLRQFPNGKFAKLASDRASANATAQNQAQSAALPLSRFSRPFDRAALMKESEPYKISIPEIILGSVGPLPASLEDWVGIWGPTQWDGWGVPAVVVVSNVSADGKARLLYSWGFHDFKKSGRALGRVVEPGLTWLDIEIRDGEVTFVTRNGASFTFVMNAEGDLVGRMYNPVDRTVGNNIVLKRRH